MASRIRRAFLAILVALGLAAGLQAVPASAQEVDITVFHNRLAPYGHWIQHPRYGWAWHPTGVEAGWRPYTHGHWVWTAEYGWYWDSDYEWGWAPFHYGRWAFDNQYGWIWVPGQVWAPAWVVWRSGGGYVGWAPMPPEAVWQADIGFGGFDLDVRSAPAWIFCQERYLAAPRPIIVPPTRNVTIIKQTTNVTNYVTINNRIVNRSVDVHRIEAATHTRITPVHVRDVAHPMPSAKRHAASGAVQVFRPTAQPPQSPSDRKHMTNQQATANKRQPAQIEEQQRRAEVERREQLQSLERQKQQHEEARRQEQQKPDSWRRWQQQCQENPATCPPQWGTPNR
ncbi:MAG TPA: DUF6600 domain-containing protein [Dongiaceae bacterium]|jgi:hypothetical protein|nr:DUF6600 domain-containing protein [Dongiaceae bacterium]